MVLTRRDLLRTGLSAALLPLVSCGDAGRRLVLVAARGGWDPTFVFDPKPGVEGIEGPEVHQGDDADDVDVVRHFGALPIVDNPARRPAVGTFFEKWADRAVVINGMEVGTIAHLECVRRVWTGGDDDAAPDLASIAGYALDAQLPIGCLDLGPGARPGPLPSTVRLGWNGQARELAVPAEWADLEAIASWRARRWAPDADRAAFDRQRRVAAVLSDLAFDAADPLVAALDALEAGVCGAVYLDPHLPWDTHVDNSLQDGCFDALFTLLDRLAAGVDLDRTLVVVLSEMGRTPLRNEAGGKDHWPVTSALVFGVGVHGGRVLGGTDERLSPAGDVIRPANVLAGALEALDLDVGGWFPGVVPLPL
jgi:hypothetical protein